jgi:hypothetical protein
VRTSANAVVNMLAVELKDRAARHRCLARAHRTPHWLIVD